MSIYAVFGMTEVMPCYKALADSPICRCGSGDKPLRIHRSATADSPIYRGGFTDLPWRKPQIDRFGEGLIQVDYDFERLS
jgi:hypothetical protein